MKKNKLYLFFVLIVISIYSCKNNGASKNNFEITAKKDTSLIQSIATNTPLPPNTHPLSETINTFLENQNDSKDFKPTGLKRNDYLKIVEAQVRAMVQYQNESGRIIDPVDKVEKYYTTPCFAHSVAILAASGYLKDEKLIESGMKALDVALIDMTKAKVPGNHGDFYTWPAMLAYEQFLSVAKKERIEKWNSDINAIQPNKLYMAFGKLEGNWGLVNTAGEFLRAKNGFTNLEYVESMLKGQNLNFTELGMYNEGGNPLPYDLFPRHFLSGMLQMGYKGKSAITFRDILWKGAWTSLFMQSPFGEMPTGYRSSQHIWNEAEQCVVFEIYANAYAKLEKENEAGAFKRAAMLSLGSIKQWIREDGSGYIVKNKYPIESRHGYEVYSVHTCYNLLATSMLAQAWQFSNEAIKELPSPADKGGFVVPMIVPFHKIFANVKGTYLEYDTKGDQKYNPTGILRVHIKGGNPVLGPSDGTASFMNENEKSSSLGLGPLWQNADGTWTSLAEQKIEPSSFEILEERTNSVKFRVTYLLNDQKNALTQKAIIETISISDGKIIVTNEFKGFERNKRISWPMLVFNGKENTNVKLAKDHVELMLDGKGMRFSILNSDPFELKRSTTKLKHRNGIAEAVFAEFEGNSITYSLSKV